MWEYNLSGLGLKPGVMDPTHISVTLGSEGSSFIAWRNPFMDAVKVTPKQTWWPLSSRAVVLVLYNTLVLYCRTLACASPGRQHSVYSIAFDIAACGGLCLANSQQAWRCSHQAQSLRCSSVRVCLIQQTLLFMQESCNPPTHHA